MIRSQAPHLVHSAAQLRLVTESCPLHRLRRAVVPSSRGGARVRPASRLPVIFLDLRGGNPSTRNRSCTGARMFSAS